jgi:hypothetical protein
VMASATNQCSLGCIAASLALVHCMSKVPFDFTLVALGRLQAREPLMFMKFPEVSSNCSAQGHVPRQKPICIPRFYLAPHSNMPLNYSKWDQLEVASHHLNRQSRTDH